MTKAIELIALLERQGKKAGPNKTEKIPKKVGFAKNLGVYRNRMKTRSGSAIKFLKGKKWDKKQDARKKAMKPGWRRSKSGKYYFEKRANRSDLTDV